MKKTIKNRFITAITLVLLLVSCSKDDGPTPEPTPQPEVVLNSVKQLTGFTFSAADNTTFSQDITAVIDESTKVITATLPSDADITALSPTLLVSAKASVSPTGAQDFTNPVTYTVTAEDGTKAIYTATFNSNSSAKQITSFIFLLTNNPIEINVIAVIDEETKTITATMPQGTNISGLLPEIEIPTTATINPSVAQDFNVPIAYTVTAEDGSEAIYTVTVTKLSTQKEILQIILDTNPNNTLNWDLTNTADSDLGALEGITTDVEGNIIELSLEAKNLIECPIEIGQFIKLTSLSFYDNNITTIPIEIGNLVNLRELNFGINGLSIMPIEIGNLVNLTSLDFYFNGISAIPTEIGNLVNLISLDLGFNRLTTIPTEIGNLVSIEVLSLHDNRLIEIPSEIGFLTNLEELSIFSNFLITIPQAICNLEVFNGLDINKSINGETISCETVSQKDALISIYSANPGNTLGWSVDDFPGVTFNNNGNPTVLTLHNRNLERLLGNINSLSDVEVLAVNDNQLSTVPPELSQLTKLVLLTLEDNPLTGLPQSVCDQQVSNGGILTILTDFGEGCN